MTNFKAYIFGMVFHTNFWFNDIDYWLSQLILGRFKGGNFPKFDIFLWRWLDIHIFLLLAWDFSIKHSSPTPQKTFEIIFFFIMAECESSKNHLVSSADSFMIISQNIFATFHLKSFLTSVTIVGIFWSHCEKFFFVISRFSIQKGTWVSLTTPHFWLSGPQESNMKFINTETSKFWKFSQKNSMCGCCLREAIMIKIWLYMPNLVSALSLWENQLQILSSQEFSILKKKTSYKNCQWILNGIKSHLFFWTSMNYISCLFCSIRLLINTE